MPIHLYPTYYNADTERFNVRGERVLTLMRYTVRPDEVTSEVLTVDGWEHSPELADLPLNRMPPVLPG
jgi:hypothetical protein